MHRFDGRTRVLAACLTSLAGYVDALGFMALGGFFVSFMSGNSTRLAVGLAEAAPSAAKAAGLVGLFILGVVLGSLVGRRAGRLRRPMVLILVALLLAASAVLAGVASTWISAVPMAVAMGAENAVFESDGEVRVGLTYMTGTLVKVGHRAAAAMAGGPPWAWVPYLLLWGGLVAGATLGALAYAAFGLRALWFAALAASAMAAFAATTREEPD